MTRADRQAYWLYAAVAIAVGFVDYRVRPGNLQTYPVTEYIPRVIAGAYGAPADYRVLAPFTIDFLSRVTGLGPLLGYVVSRVAFIYLGLIATHVYVRQFFGSGAAIAGVLGAAALLPLTFTNGWANPDSFPELVLFTLGCLFVARRNDALFLLTLIAATLNRETAVFLVLLWGAHRLPGAWRTALPRFAGYALVWAAIYVGVRWLRGFQSYELWMLGQNIDSLVPAPAGYDPYRRIFGLFWILFLAAPTVLAVRGSRLPGTPPFIRHALPVFAAFIVTCCLISKVIEARIFVPAIPLLILGVIRAFAEPVQTLSEHSAAGG
jgi:hypothetical protein